MIFIDEYKDKVVLPPNEDIDPKLKVNDKEMFKRKCEYIWSCYIRQTGLYTNYNNHLEYRMLRAYATGTQPEEIYMNRLSPPKRRSKKGNDFRRKGFMNVSWKVVSVMPKFINAIMGKFDSIDYPIHCRSIDEQSDAMRHDMKLSALVESKYKKELDQIRQGAGMRAPDMKLPFSPSNFEEIEMLDTMGSFKLKFEIAMETALRKSSADSDWEELKKMLLKDGITLGLIATKDYTDPVTQKVMTRYVDPEYLIMRSSQRADYADITEAGEICFASVGQLRAMGVVEPEDIQQIAKMYNGQMGNPLIDYRYDPTNPADLNRYDAFKIAYLDTEFESLDTDVYETRVNQKGEVLTFPTDFTHNKETATRTTQRVKYEKWYRAKWIIGTNIVFDYGPQFDVPYTQEDKPVCSYTIYRVAERSIVSQCQTTVDDFQLLSLKLRNAIAKARPSGIQVEWGSLSNISDGGDKLGPFDILQIYRDNGDLIYRAPVLPNGTIIQGTGSPVQELKGGIGGILDESIRGFEMYLNLIREITGLGQGVDGSSPAAGTLVGTLQIQETATNAVLKPVLSSYRNVKLRSFKNMSYRWLLWANLMDGPTSEAIGDINSDILKIGSDMAPMSRYGIVLGALIDDNAKQVILQAANESIKAAKAGQAGISMRDFVYITRMLDEGNLRMAEVYLAYREQQESAKLQQIQQQNSQMNSQVAIQQEQVKQQGVMQKAKMEDELNKNKAMYELQKDLTILRETHRLKMEEITLQSKLDAQYEMKTALATNAASHLIPEAPPPIDPNKVQTEAA